MNANPEFVAANASGASDVPSAIAEMSREALVRLVDSLFRWALKRTGVTRTQILAEIGMDASATRSTTAQGTNQRAH